MDTQLSQDLLLKSLYFLQVHFNDHMYMGLFLGFLDFPPLICLSLTSVILNYYYFAKCLDIL